ncbi:Dihydrolipoyllysine-residue acetyltransferase component of pyruvate dehydrogenase complex [Aquisphaera giovannonii]|uniref:Dihydrolipoamide acetyltransferase component of pyruvate dehydrogenase complex n=1 Tax=Aquisphaera giovannonii TaxID=406548 RepID=A0A5B9W8F3_9BACT|nr:dihydrolipoamide acetyltransferase family protein [Aquisphaera giovannonii]QEH36647.1 Dihydrolipoyllysine-residue acetyltransferase component of pyruvate dehydrogenase complex [Aquisphaera giovannonii]
MPIEVTMPKLSPTMETGVIAQWLVKVGDQIKEGDVLADIETDKATMQMKSYEDGTIVRIDRPAGDEVALGDRVMVLAKPGEDPKEVESKLAGGGEKKAAKPAGAGPVHSGNGQPTVEDEAEDGVAEDSESDSAANGEAGRVKASPLARKMAAASRVDLTKVRGSGPSGRIVRRDIDDFLAGKPAAPAAAKAASGGAKAAPAAAAKAPAAPAPVAARAASPADERIPHTRMRKTIAQRMVQSKQSVPEIHVTVDIRVDKLVAIREELNRALAAEKLKLSLGDFVTKAVAMALRKHPGLNATFEEDAIVRKGSVNIGFAVALDAGLIVPVVQNADSLGLADIRRQSEALVAAARGNNLSTDQLTGATFTISNLGMYGVRQFDAIINLPEVAILAVAAAEKRPVVEGDKLVPGTVLTVTLSADHRAVDGAMAADFLRTLKRLLEEPAMMLL